MYKFKFFIYTLLVLIFFGGAHFHKQQIWPFGQGYYVALKDIKKYGINYKNEKGKAEEKKVEKKGKAEALKMFDVCNIPRSYNVKDNSHAFIGHAYGRHRKNHKNNYLSPEAENFIRKNLSKLSSLIFTGDVFQSSSAHKWRRLRFEAGEGMNILVARGNHDQIDIFKESEFGQYSFPHLSSLNEIPLIIDGSTSNKGGVVSNETIELANNLEADLLIIARHHIPVVNLKHLANGGYSFRELPSVKDLVHKFDKDKMYYWIIGDGGAFSHLPRLSCLKYKNHTFITNGLGMRVGDSVILLHDKELSEYVISSEIMKIEALR